MARQIQAHKGETNKERNLRVSQRRAEVAKQYLQHVPQFQIAINVGVSDVIISQDLKAILDQWVKSGVRDFDAQRAEELSRINYLEAVYWEEFRNSKLPKTATSSKERTGPGGGGRGRLPPPGPQVVVTPQGTITNQPTNPGSVVLMTETSATETTRDGDPRYLEGVQWCIETRIKLMGLNAPSRGTLDVTLIKAYGGIDLDMV